VAGILAILATLAVAGGMVVNAPTGLQLILSAGVGIALCMAGYYIRKGRRLGALLLLSGFIVMGINTIVVQGRVPALFGLVLLSLVLSVREWPRLS
jgi:hypothetical protein